MRVHTRAQGSKRLYSQLTKQVHVKVYFFKTTYTIQSIRIWTLTFLFFFAALAPYSHTLDLKLNHDIEVKVLNFIIH